MTAAWRFDWSVTGGRSYVISGPLDKPHVETVTAPSAEAALR